MGREHSTATSLCIFLCLCSDIESLWSGRGWFPDGESRFGHLHIGAQFFFSIGYAIGKDHSDAAVKIVSPFLRRAYVEVDQISQNWLLRKTNVREAGEIRDGLVDYGPGRVGALTNEGFGARRHLGEIVGNEEELDGSFVWILDDDLELTDLRDAIRSSWRRCGCSSVQFVLTSMCLVVILIIDVG